MGKEISGLIRSTEYKKHYKKKGIQINVFFKISYITYKIAFICF